MRAYPVGRRATGTAVVWLSVALPLLATHPAAAPRARITVVLQGHQTRIAEGTRLGALLRDTGMRPERGRLLDVEGTVIDGGGRPGTVLLNGARAPRATVLDDGDRITVLGGRDSVESTRRLVEALPGRLSDNPQFTLASASMERVTTVGRVSGKVLSVDRRPRSRMARPAAVALTFDDGPWPGTTRKILGVLGRLHVEATFFMVGALARRYPGIVRSVRRAGMAIGSHSDTHPYSRPFTRLPTWRRLREIRRGRDALARLGIATSLFRPPGGAVSGRVLREAAGTGSRVVIWDVDPRDWQRGTGRKELVRRVLARVRRGSIVLLHDGGGDQRATIAALPAIVRGIRKMGLDLVALDEGRTGPERAA